MSKWTFTPPTEPGTYWIKRYSRAVISEVGADRSKPVAVTVIRGETGRLMVLWPGDDVPAAYKRDHEIRQPEGHMYDDQWWPVPLAAPDGFESNEALELRDLKARRTSLDERICELARALDGRGESK